MSEVASINSSTRGLVLLLAAALLTPLIVAATLTPDPRGLGTHQQLGLPVCTWPAALGIPCPSCGMTTAFAYAARADLSRAFVTQPMGALLAIAAAIGCVVSLGVSLTGYQFQRLFDPILNKWCLSAAVLLFFVAWFWKFSCMRGWT
ncbi:MAG: DUF2752 domain-containing protein [Phycisphaerales bacterium]|nr:DUF2752 domain-containing protein [Phycisphaerales bacterium]